MKNIIPIFSILLTVGCSTKEIIDSSVRTPSGVSHYVCTEYGQSKNSNPISAVFDFLKMDEIFNVKVNLKSTDNESEVFSSDNKSVIGTPSAKNAELLMFSIIEENKDRFDLFINKKNFGSQQFFATAKISFDEDASKNIKLNCKSL